MKTASWWTQLPPNHLRIGISRGVPRRLPAGYRIYRKLAPGPWFASVGTQEYYDRYMKEILAPLDRQRVIAELTEMALGRVPVLLCFERPGDRRWCHRSVAAAWLSEGLGRTVPEFGFESLPQNQHPMLPAELGPAALPERAW
jgi:hypothetical protein